LIHFLKKVSATLTPDGENVVNGAGQAQLHGNRKDAELYQVLQNNQRMEVGLAPRVNSKKNGGRRFALLKASRKIYLVRPFLIGAEPDGPIAKLLAEEMLNSSDKNNKDKIQHLFLQCKKDLNIHINNHRNNAMGALKKVAKSKL